MLRRKKMRGLLTAVFIWAFGAQGVAAENTTPEYACLFFFDYLGKGVDDRREEFARQRVTRIVDFGDPKSSMFGLPRYLMILWPRGLAESGPIQPNGDFVHSDNVAFSMTCLVDIIDLRVLTIEINTGVRRGEVLPISPARDGTPRGRAAVDAGEYTINVGNSVTRGLY